MSSGARVAVAAGSSSSSIPANARKVVQDLKEIVRNGEDEIYAMLKECNMDPNETVQRLLSQDTFHEVKRKRDKKKENVSKESGEARLRPSGAGSSSLRGGRVPDRGTGRGNYIPRYNFELSGGGRGQSLSGRDNSRALTSTSSVQPVQPQVQIKTSASNAVVTMATDSIMVPNGSSPYTRPPQMPRGSWSAGPGQATMADIVKSSSAQKYAATTTSVSTSKALATQQLASTSPNVVPDALSPSIDPVDQMYVESHARGPVDVKQDSGMEGNQRSAGEQAPVLSMDAVPMIESLQLSPQVPQSSTNAFSTEVNEKVHEVDIPSTSISLSPQEQAVTQDPLMEVGSLSEGPVVSSSSGSPAASVSRNTLVSNQFNGRVVYQTQQQPVGSQKGSGLEWKPKSPTLKSTVFSEVILEASSVDARQSPPATPQHSTGMLLDSTSKLQQLSIQDDQPVIIPNHLQVPEADRTHLNFGSFGEDFDTPFSTNFSSEDDNKSSVRVEDDSEAPAEAPNASSLKVSTPVSLEQTYSYQSTAPPVEAVPSSDDVAISMPMPVISPVVSRPEVSKSAPVVQQGAQYPYLSTLPSYPGFGIVPQLMGSQYTYEPSEPQPQEVSRLPSFVSHYSDAGGNYYSPVFRPTPDVDARYSHFVPTNTTNKYNTGVSLMTGQGLSSSQEGGNSLVMPATGHTGQTSQMVGVAQTGLTIPQQHVPIHAYPAQHAGIPISPFSANVFGFQYVPPSYGYMPSHYQHSYATNTGYPQAPSGNSYAPAGAGPYTPTGTAAIKYSLPQYKPGAAAGSAPHAAVAAGYGNFTASPSGFATVVTTATASGYDDVSVPQYKENNLYIPGQQQAEGSTVWIQTQPSRDIAGMQTNSFYNMLGQGQHSGYAHTQPMHAVPAAAYANLYHQSQSGTAPTVHQLLQQPQSLGAVGGGAQSGAYQQPQRGQLNWTNNY